MYHNKKQAAALKSH